MNERIKQMATEVGISVEYLNTTKQWSLIEALAERIVGECMDQVWSNSQPAGSPDSAYANFMVAACAKSIRQHFGAP